MIYRVLKTTGPGYLSVTVYPPASDGGNSMNADAFVDVTTPGTYGMMTNIYIYRKNPRILDRYINNNS